MQFWIWILFGIATLFGIALMWFAVMHRPPSSLMKMSHFGFVIAGLVVIIISALQGQHALWIALVLALFVVASGIVTSVKRRHHVLADLQVSVHAILAVLWYICLVTVMVL